MKKTLLCFALLALQSARGQDILGGFFQVHRVSGQTHSLTLQLFTDASIPLSRPTVAVNYGDGQSATCPFVTAAVDNGIVRSTYAGTYTYPGPGAYLAACSGSFRVAGIHNMLQSGAQPLWVQSLLNLNAFSMGFNSTPGLSYYPPHAATKGVPLTYSPGFSDVDGDSLSYELVPCSGDGYYIPATATVDPASGLFSFVPDTAGHFLFAMQIREWRKNGSGLWQTIGTSHLEFTIRVHDAVGLAEGGSYSPYVLFPNPAASTLSLRGKKEDREAVAEIFNSQ